MQLSIRWKLVAIFLALTVSIFLLMEFFIGTRVRHLLERKERMALARDCQLVADLLSARLARKVSPVELDSLAVRISRNLDARVTIHDSSGGLLAVAEARPLSENRTPANAEARQAPHTGDGVSARSVDGGETLHYAFAFRRGGKTIGTVRLSRPKDMRSLFSIYQMVSLSGFVSVVLVLGLSVLIAGRIVQPLRRMVHFAKQVTANRFDKHLVVSSKDELGDLAAALSGMALRLAHTLDDLTAKRNHLQAILAGMAEGVLITDLHGRILLANQSFKEIFSLAGPVEGRDVQELLGNVTLQKAMTAASRDRQTTVAEFSTNEVPPRFLEVRVVPFGRIGAGGPESAIGLVAVFHEVTELKQLERVRKDFIRNVSQQLRAPLTTIKGFTATLCDMVKIETAQARQFLEIINRHAARMSRMVEDLLEISRLESQPISAEVSALDLSEFIGEAVQSFQRACEKKSIRLQAELPHPLPPVLATSRTLKQVLANLLDNAHKYTPEGGRIFIRAIALPNEVLVHIQDSGIGIPAADLDRIFERFYRVDQKRSSDSAGAGLGLSIVKHSLRAVGGRVWAESEPGRGSTFSFALPRAVPAVLDDQPPASA